MKKIILFLFFCSVSIFAQEQKAEKIGIVSPKNFFFEASGALGLGELNTKEIRDLRGNVKSAAVLFGYTPNGKLRFKTGLGWTEFSESSIFPDGTYSSFQSSFLNIPVKIDFTVCSLYSDKAQLVLGYGFFSNYHLKNEFKSNVGDSEVKNINWHFGSAIDFGVEFKMAKDILVGVYLESQFASKKFADNETLRLTSDQIKMSFLYFLKD